MLTKSLQELEAHDLIIRKSYDTIPLLKNLMPGDKVRLNVNNAFTSDLIIP
jgi:hypothetical protein